MRRHLLIASLVLIPFAGLVAFGFSLLKDPPPIALPTPAVRYVPQVAVEPEPPAVPVPVPAPAPVEVPVAAPVVVAPPPEPPPPPQPELSPEAKRLPIIAAVEPLVMQCFRDMTDRVREPLQVTVSFNATGNGRFENVVLKKTSWQDPHLTACVLDSFADAHFEPGGAALKRQSYTFTFAVPDGGL